MSLPPLTSILLAHNGLHIELVIDRNHPVGRGDAAGLADVVLESALTTIVDLEDSVAAVDAADKAEAYRKFDDLTPSATGYAYGNFATYLASMKRFYVEDTETSALARAIKTLSPSTMRPSVEEMNRVDYLSVVPEMPKSEVTVEVSEARDPWAFASTIEAVTAEMTQPGAILDVPTCSHGAMAYKEGIGKTGKPYRGYVCTNTNRDFQCPPRWDK
jgi:hypothetical protein